MATNAKIDGVKDRENLAIQREPHWLRLDVGQHLGYRKTGEGSGFWVCRYYDSEKRTRTFHSLGHLKEIPPKEQFGVASKQARAWFKHMTEGGKSEVQTVAAVCKTYVEHRRQKDGDAAAADAEGRIKRHIAGDPIASIEVAKLTHHNVAAWRKRLEARPAAKRKRSTDNEAPPAAKPRSASSINRDMVPLRAALYLALRNGYATSDAAWRTELEPIAKAGGRRTTYLTPDQRRALLKALPDDDIRNFVKALCLLPMRVGAVAALLVRDFNSREGTLTVSRDKAGEGRVILLPKSAADHFRAMAKDKLPDAPLLCRWDGRPWDKDMWKGPIKAAAASVEPAATAYTLRHSTISDLVSNGLDLFSVAVLSGTSVSMIEKFYGHLKQTKAQAALAGLAL